MAAAMGAIASSSEAIALTLLSPLRRWSGYLRLAGQRSRKARSANRPTSLSHDMACRSLLIAVLLVAVADPALANWWIVRASDGKCVVVDIEPTENDKTVTKVGKDVYQTPERAEADVKRLCKESKAPDQPPRDPGNAK